MKVNLKKADNNLLPHQVGVRDKLLEIIERNGFAYLVGEARSGKTRSALAVASNLGGGPVLIITKKSAIGGWESEIEDSGILKGGDVTIVNYESAHKIGLRLWGILILDEAHHSISSFPRKSVGFGKVLPHAKMARVRLALSATPSAENFAKLFHQFVLLGHPEWSAYSNFYSWFLDYHGGKVEADGTRKIPMVEVRGIEGKNYACVDAERIMKSISSFKVSISKTEAIEGWKGSFDRVLSRMGGKGLVRLENELSKNGIVSVLGHTIIAEGGADMISKRQQIEGGSLIAHTYSRKDRAHYVHHLELSGYKAEWIVELFKGEGLTVIMCAFEGHIRVVKRILGDRCTDCFEAFKGGGFSYFVGNVNRYAEGVDMSFADRMVIYSMSWSATTYIQVRDRLCNMKRTSKVEVFFLIGGKVDAMIYKAVAEDKKNFTSIYFKDNK